ncbi:MAG: uracil-DNA glycosylase [Bacteroidetes bacterium]|nr:uracil-DNA glycosylase [Bacteroidota bacterium]
MDGINPKIEESWKKILEKEFKQDYFSSLKSFLIEEKKRFNIFPPGNQIFSAFNHTPFNKVKAVIIGQDPYHGLGQANGLCFSVSDGIKKPPSLQNIFKELNSDLNIKIPEHGNLEKWAQQGVLMLNATLTVRENLAGSHQNKGWENFTDAVIKVISNNKKGIVFILWGNFAQAKTNLIDQTKHFIVKAAHPSPFSAYKGFLGCKNFSQTNELLIKQGLEPIDWSL